MFTYYQAENSTAEPALVNAIEALLNKSNFC